MASGEDLTVPDGTGSAVADAAPDLSVEQGGVPTPRAPRGRRRPNVPTPITQGAAFVAAQRDPERHAKVVDLADRLNMSPAFVDQNYDDLAKAADQRTTMAAMDSVSPTLRNWLSDPDNASIAKKEIGPLAQVDRGAKLLTPPAPIEEEGQFDAIGNATATGMSDLALSTHLLAAAFGHTTPAQAATDIAAAKVRSNALRADAPQYAQEYQTAIQEHQGDLNKAREMFLGGQKEARKAGILNALVSYASGQADPMAMRTLGETLSLIAAHANGWNRLKGFAYQNIEGLASMAPMLGGTAAGTGTGALIGSAVPVVGTAIGGVIGGLAGTFAGAAPVNIGSEIEQEMQKRGVDLTDPVALEKALSDSTLMQLVRDKAVKAGITSAGVMTLFNGLGGVAGGLAGKEATAAAKVASKSAAITLPAAGVAAGTEAGAAAKGEAMDPARALSTTLQMLVFGGAMEAVHASSRALFNPETAKAADQATVKATDAMRAQHDAQVMTEVGQAVKEAATTGSVPDRLKSLIETATGGQEAATVYFQSGEWDKYWQEQGASPAKAAADIMGDDGKAYHDAQATGARFAIPLSDYIARVATTPHFEGLIDVARTRPDGMSFGEAREYLQSLPATMKELADEATAQAKGEPAPLESSAAQVRQDVEGQLLKAGIAPTAAKAQAQLYESAFRTLGARANVSARELFNRYGLTIGRGPLEPTPEATAKIAAAKKAAEAATAQEVTLTEASTALKEQIKAPDLGLAERAKGRAKFLGDIVPTFSDEAEAARVTEAEGEARATPLARPRTASGRLKNLGKATTEELANEYKTLIDANATENTALTAIDTGSVDALWTGMKPGAMKAMGRIAARAKTLAKLEAEFQKRGIDPAEAYMAGYQNSVNQEPTGFQFNQGAKAKATIPTISADVFNKLTNDQFDLLAEDLHHEVDDGHGRAGRLDYETQDVADQFGQWLSTRRGTLTGDLHDALNAFAKEEGISSAAKRRIDEVISMNRLATPPTIFEQAMSGGPRGRISFGDGREFRIELLKNADRSTFLHETGHFYLEVLGDLAKASGAAEDLKADYQTIREWVGAEADKPLTTEQHEQFARGFEAYLMEGKAPNSDLRTAFFRFKNWLLDIYRNLRSLNVELTPEVRTVFDRMLASQEEIRQAEAEENVGPLFDDPRALGMTEDQAASYARAAGDARESAESELTTRLMKGIRREESAEWKAWRDPIEAEVRSDVNARPVYQAIEYMANHRHSDGTPLEANAPEMKLSRDVVKQLYGDEAAKGLPRGVLAAANDLFATPPDVAAEMFGFANGRELVDAMRAAPKREAAIKAETDARMQDEHGQRLTDVAVRELATQTLHSEKRVQLLRKELEYLASEHLAAFKGLVRTVAKKIPASGEVREQAANIVGETKVRDLRPDLLAKAATRASVEARDALLKGDIDGAFEAKRKELLATEVYRAAEDHKATIDKSLDDFKKVFKSDASLEKTRDLSFVNAARAVLSELGIGSSDKGGGAYLALVKEYAPDAYDNVQAITEDIRNLGLRDYRDLTADQFTELATTVKQLWTQARKAKQVVLDGKVQQLEEVLTPILDEVHARQSERTAARGKSKSLDITDKLANFALSAEASMSRVESWARGIDGLNVLGPMSKVIREVLNATNRYRQHKTDVVERLAKATQALAELPAYRDIVAHELGGYTFKDRSELLGAILHTGNAKGGTSNLSKLLLGRGWATADENGLVDRGNWDAFVRRMQKDGILTKADYDWVQSAWDFFEELKPELQRAYFDVNGRYMKEVEHTPFETPFGNYKGGYYPAIGDTHVAGGAEIENAMRASEDQLLGTDGKFLLTQPASGMTKTRTGKVWPLVMDATQLPRHLDAVLKYIHMAPPVREVFKVVNHRDFREAMAGVNPSMVSDALIPFLRAASSQRAQAPETTALGRAFASSVNYIRQGAMQQVVGANLVILAEQVLHTSALQSMRTADNKAMVYYHDVASAAARIMLSPKTLTDLIHEQSETIATRDHTRLRAAEVAYKAIMDPSKLRTMQEVAAHSIGFVSHVVSSLMDKAVWLGAHDRASQRGLSDADARDYADAVVRQGLGAHNPEDIANIQRGTAMQKAMLGMYGFFNAKANQLGTDAFAKTMTDAGLRRSRMRMAAVYTFGLLALSMSGAAARDIIGGRKKKEDETWTDVLAEWAGWGQAEALGRFVPGGNVAIQFGKTAFHKAGASADNMLSSPSATFLTNAVGAARTGHRLVTGEPLTGKDVKDALGFFGTLFHLPLKPLARPISYQMDVQAGKTTPTGPIDYTRGLITGQRGR